MRRMPALVFWPLAVAVCVAAACLLAAPVHDLLVGWGWMPAHAPGHGRTRDFLRVFRRLLLLPLLAVFLARVRPWREHAWEAFGLAPRPARLRGALRAGLLTTALLLAVLAGHMATGWLRWEHPLRWGELARRVPLYLAGGLVVGFLEEWFFRGWLLRRATRDVGAIWGVVAMSATYALVHAFHPSSLDAAVGHDAAGAFQALLGWVAAAGDLEHLGPAFLGLFLFSVVLTAAWKRTGTLWTGIGIHAAGVFVLSCYGALTVRRPARTWAGTRLLYDGPVLWVPALLVAWWLWPKGGSNSAAPGPSRPGLEPRRS
jgi:hypothetical protein